MHTHLKIWDKAIPLNTGLTKYNDLEPYDKDMPGFKALAFSFDPKLRRRDLIGPNTAARKLYIEEKHFISDKYDDEPYIVPFLTDKSDLAVLVVPGGAYQDVSLDGEGYPMALYLQEHGINAFVLKYRVYPYKYPSAALDCRRALCYLKYNAKELKIDPNKINLIGFSAGGNLVGVTTYLMKNMPQIQGYQMDDIDRIDPSPATVAPIYPELEADPFLLANQFGQRIYDDEEFFQNIVKEQYIPQYTKENKTPVFMCQAIDDGVVDPINVLKMASECHKNKVIFELHLFSEGGHGFGAQQEDFPPMFGLPRRRMDGTKEWVNLYITWIKKMATRD